MIDLVGRKTEKKAGCLVAAKTIHLRPAEGYGASEMEQ
jgi:hypothetical protein